MKIKDHIQTINEIKVVMELDAVPIVNDITLDLNEGSLVILNEGSSCC